MLWRLWSFLSGLPLGGFAAIATSPDAETAAARAPWGAPTGLALDPDRRRLVLGQRRARSGRTDERLVGIALDCNATALARSRETPQ